MTTTLNFNKRTFMLPNGRLNKSVTKRDQILWAKVMTAVLAALEHFERVKINDKFDVVMECHSICRALAHIVPETSFVDGLFLGLGIKEEQEEATLFEMRQCSHSWLMTPDGAIIDPYPVGFITANAVLIGSKTQYSPWGRDLYRPDRRVTARISTRKMARTTSVLTRFMKAAMTQKE